MEHLITKNNIFVKKYNIMNTVQLQNKLLDLTGKIQDARFLQAIVDLINSHLEISTQRKTDWYSGLPNYVRDELDEALLESERGEGIVHEEFMKQFKEEYKI